MKWCYSRTPLGSKRSVLRFGKASELLPPGPQGDGGVRQARGGGLAP